MQFHAVASTGRTATTFLARALNQLPRVAACHEGYLAADKDETPLLPLINLENRRAYQDREAARNVVAAKRGAETIATASRALDCETLIDVAYYNSTIADALLSQERNMRMVAIIRRLEPFVRSATAMEGEDPMPVGWPDPGKPLTARERFIEMGRIRPAKDSDEAAAWEGWSAIMRNIWLWRETNALLLAAAETHGERVLVLPFEDLSHDPASFTGRIAAHFGLPTQGISDALHAARDHKNKKASGYQIGPLVDWTDEEKAFAQAARETIGYELCSM